MSSQLVDGFELVARCEVAGVTVQKFKSTRTGVVVCLAQVEGPLVEGFFCLGGRGYYTYINVLIMYNF